MLHFTGCTIMDDQVCLLLTISVLQIILALTLIKLRRARDGRAGRVSEGPFTADRRMEGAYYRTVPRLIIENDGELDDTELLDNRVGTFRNYFRMRKCEFDYILENIREDLEKFLTRRTPIGPEERLMVTLRYLATGQSMTSLHYEWHISVAAISKIIPEVCGAIMNRLKTRWLSTPRSADQWLQVSNSLDPWNFPNCLGAIDGKHVAMNKPWNAGSEFHNYKGFESVVLLATCDGNYRFTYVECGSEGRASDGGIFSTSPLARVIDSGEINFPVPRIPPNGADLLPFVLIGDEAFPLKPYMMRPYSGRMLPFDEDNFNKRLSRCRRLIENSFGILAATWRILLRRMDVEPDKVRLVVMACCLLHNILRANRRPPQGAQLQQILDHSEHTDETFQSVTGTGSRPRSSALTIRNRFKDYVGRNPIVYDL